MRVGHGPSDPWLLSSGETYQEAGFDAYASIQNDEWDET